VILTQLLANGSDNGQSDDTTTGLDPEDNQQTLQQESVTELATVVPITIQEDFLWDLCDYTEVSYMSSSECVPKVDAASTLIKG